MRLHNVHSSTHLHTLEIGHVQTVRLMLNCLGGLCVVRLFLRQAKHKSPHIMLERLSRGRLGSKHCLHCCRRIDKVRRSTSDEQRADPSRSRVPFEEPVPEGSRKTAHERNGVSQEWNRVWDMWRGHDLLSARATLIEFSQGSIVVPCGGQVSSA